MGTKITKLADSKKGFFIALVFCTMFVHGCFPSYRSHTDQYIAEFSQNSLQDPNYADLKYWAAHPWKKDPSDSIPKSLRNENTDSLVDVFFLHPTTLTDKKLQGKLWNADINDAALNAKTDYNSILYQASAFNGHARVFAPRYRQAHIFSFFTEDKQNAATALNFAYEDVKKAFRFYLEHYNNGRPFIIAAHSQGTVHAGRLLKDFIENTPLQNKLVCAYLVGMVLPKDYFLLLPVCKDSSQTGCFAGWRTYRKNYTPDYIEKENGNSWVVNPLSWRTDDSPVTRTENKGAVLYNFEKLFPHTNGAKIENNILWINKPKFPFAFLLRTKNYHAGDINLFYLSIRENAGVRIRSYFLQRGG